MNRARLRRDQAHQIGFGLSWWSSQAPTPAKTHAAQTQTGRIGWLTPFGLEQLGIQVSMLCVLPIRGSAMLCTPTKLSNAQSRCSYTIASVAARSKARLLSLPWTHPITPCGLPVTQSFHAHAAAHTGDLPHVALGLPQVGRDDRGSGPSWLRQIVAAKTAKHRAHASRSGRPLRKTATPQSWMSKMKRRSSMDLEDEDVELCKKRAAAAAVPGGWLKMGSLGAPDAVDEERALDEARAASFLTR